MVSLADNPNEYFYYGHDHLFSPVVLFDETGTPAERYEYDAYGKVSIYDGSFNADADNITNYANPYQFTGRRLDTLDSGDYEVMYYRARYYSTETGRFLQKDPLGVVPSPQKPNRFWAAGQYSNSLNIYTYVVENPIVNTDSYGLYYDNGWRPGGGSGSGKSVTLPSFSQVIGFSGSIAYYYPFPPPASLGGVYVKFSGTVTAGICCDRQLKRKRNFHKWKAVGEVGVYTGTPGLKVKATVPLVENLKDCPKSQALQCTGILKASARVWRLSGSCTYSFKSEKWSCSGGFRLNEEDLTSVRFTFSGGVECSRTTVYDNGPGLLYP